MNDGKQPVRHKLDVYSVSATLGSIVPVTVEGVGEFYVAVANGGLVDDTLYKNARHAESAICEFSGVIAKYIVSPLDELEPRKSNYDRET